MHARLPTAYSRYLPRQISATRSLAVCLVGVAALAFTARGQTSTGACSPGVREIFDFQVGDVFQYRIYEPSVEPSKHTEIVRKCKVDSRNESGFIRTYDFSCLESQSDLAGGALAEKRYNSYRETRAYLDTAHSPFNACPGEIVPMTSSPNFETRVKAYLGDTSVFPLAEPGLRMKAYGPALGVWRDTALAIIPDIDQMETYAEGLGLVSAAYGGFPMPPTTYALVGYVKGTTTAGVVSPDSSFWHTTTLRPPAARSAGRGSYRGPGGGPEAAYDAEGRRMPAMRTRVPDAATRRFRK